MKAKATKDIRSHAKLIAEKTSEVERDKVHFRGRGYARRFQMYERLFSPTATLSTLVELGIVTRKQASSAYSADQKRTLITMNIGNLLKNSPGNKAIQKLIDSGLITQEQANEAEIIEEKGILLEAYRHPYSILRGAELLLEKAGDKLSKAEIERAKTPQEKIDLAREYARRIQTKKHRAPEIFKRAIESAYRLDPLF